MADSFVEVLVARKTPGYYPVLKVGTIVLSVISFLLGMFLWPAMLVFVALILVYFLVIPRMNVEYEYTYLGDQLNVDKVINKSKRKKCGEYDFDHIEIVAMKNGSDVKPLLNNPNNKKQIIDYTSNNGDKGVYVIVFRGQDGQKLILFEPNEKLLNAMKYTSPRKVNLEC